VFGTSVFNPQKPVLCPHIIIGFRHQASGLRIRKKICGSELLLAIFETDRSLPEIVRESAGLYVLEFYGYSKIV